MDTQTTYEEIKKQQRETWNKSSPGWKKWEEQNNRFASKASQAIIDAVKLKDNYQVLDIASGTGEPALSIAKVVKNGKVILTDIAEDMLAVADENAKQMGLTNVELKVCSADALPFEDNFFDAVTCRFGFMLFPDIQKAANEMYRVLKPGGVMSTAVWSLLEKNPFATTIINILNKHVEMPPPSPDTLGMFRCAKPGFIAEFLKKSGFNNVSEHEVQLNFTANSVDTYWNFMIELAGPVVRGMSKADNVTKEVIKTQVYKDAEKFMKNNEFSVPATALIVTATK
jgi:ubiquinone/menaquinone biosynthesis C-methylase UbiE